MMIAWRIRGKIVRTVLCRVVKVVSINWGSLSSKAGRAEVRGQGHSDGGVYRYIYPPKISP